MKRFLEVFPEIDAIQFRMHDESGLKNEEIQPFWHDVFASIKENHPELRLDLRAKGLPDAVIDDAVGMGLKSKISTKFWMEQMGLPFHPTHINTEDQRNRRHSYADLLTLSAALPGSLAAVERRHHAPVAVGRSRLRAPLRGVRASSTMATVSRSTRCSPPRCSANRTTPKPLDILNPAYRYYDYEFERYWHFYRLFGRLTYNPEARAGGLGARVRRTLSDRRRRAHSRTRCICASQVLPRIVAASYRYSNFPTTRGWAEMNRQGSLPEYAGEQGSDIQQFMNVRDEARSIVAGTDTAMRRPRGNQPLVREDRGRDSRGSRRRGDIANGQRVPIHRHRPEDSRRPRALPFAAAARRSRYNLYKQTGDLASFDDAIADEKSALDAWSQIVDGGRRCVQREPRLRRARRRVQPPLERRAAAAGARFRCTAAERAKAPAKEGAKHYALHPVADPPSATLLPAKGLRGIGACCARP